MLTTVGKNGRSYQHHPRPDFVGLDRQGRWLIAESKGRSGGFDRVACADAKRQTRFLKQIDGQYPSVRVAVQAWFISDALAWSLADPEDFEPDAPDFVLPAATLLASYYDWLMDLLGDVPSTVTWADRPFRVVELPELGGRIGLDDSIWRSLKDGKQDLAPTLRTLPVRRPSRFDLAGVPQRDGHDGPGADASDDASPAPQAPNSFVGNDGVAVFLDPD